MYDLPDEIRVEAASGIPLVTLDRPEDRNPASTAMLFALTALAYVPARDEAARVLILTVDGPAFSAGGNFQRLVRCAHEIDLARATLGNARAFIAAMINLPIAAVNGALSGFGATLAALRDTVLIADTTR